MSDMTRGPILATIVGFGLPLAVANLAQQGYLLVDSVIVGRYLGVDALAAVGASQPLFALMTGVFAGAATAFSVRLGTLKGAGATPGRAVAGALVTCVAAWSAACLLLTVAATGPVLALIGAGGAVDGGARRFLLVLAAGLPAVFGLTAVTAAQQGLGDARSAMRVTVLTSALNALLGWWLVGPMGLGIGGAALATGLANLAGLAFGLHQLRRRWPIPPRAASAGGVRAELGRTLRLAVPMAAVGRLSDWGDVDERPDLAGRFLEINTRFRDRVATFLDEALRQHGRELVVAPALLTDAIVAIAERSIRRALLAGDSDPDVLSRAILPGLLLAFSRPASPAS